jgi:hypothetical protein
VHAAGAAAAAVTGVVAALCVLAVHSECARALHCCALHDAHL